MGKGRDNAGRTVLIFTRPEKTTEFGQAPPGLNVAGQLIQGGNTPPSLNLGVDCIKGMVPQTLAKIPLEQSSPSSQPSSGNQGSSGSTAAGSDNSQTTNSEKG